MLSVDFSITMGEIILILIILSLFLFETLMLPKQIVIEQKKEPAQTYTTPPPTWLIEINNYLDDNIATVTPDKLASEFAMSRKTLDRKLKTATGKTTKQYIKEFSLRKAKELVDQNGIQSIKQLAYAVGYSKPSYFAKEYEEKFGCKLSDKINQK